MAKNLRLKNSVWHINMRIPKHAQAEMRKTSIHHSLHTSNLHEAIASRDKLIALFSSLRTAGGSSQQQFTSFKDLYKDASTEELENSLIPLQDDIDAYRALKIEPPGANAKYFALRSLQGVKPPEAFDYTLSEAKDDYLALVSGQRHYKTITNYHAAVRDFGDMAINSILKSDVYKWTDKVRESIGYSRRSNLLSALSQLWEFAESRDRIDSKSSNPFKGINHGSKNDKQPFDYMPDELLAKILLQMDPVEHLPALICRLMGTRIEEVFMARHELVEGVDCLRTGVKTTAGKERLVPIHADLLSEVMRWLKGGRVLSASKKSAAYSKRFARAKRKVGIESRSLALHSLRVCFVTDAYRAGYSEALVAEIVGHANKTITQHYHRGFEVGKLREVVNSTQFAMPASSLVGGDI